MKKLVFFYDPFAPEKAPLGNPTKQLESSYRGIIFVGLAPSVFFLFYKLKKKSS
jgi:hypothetical protein